MDGSEFVMPSRRPTSNGWPRSTIRILNAENRSRCAKDPLSSSFLAGRASRLVTQKDGVAFLGLACIEKKKQFMSNDPELGDEPDPRPQEYSAMTHRDEDERLLGTIMQHGVAHKLRHQTIEIGGGGHVPNDPEHRLEAEGREADPLEEALCREWLGQMRKAEDSGVRCSETSAR
jgi:hypothetical protein